jgi:hypothetical protein
LSREFRLLSSIAPDSEIGFLSQTLLPYPHRIHQKPDFLASRDTCFRFKERSFRFETAKFCLEVRSRSVPFASRSAGKESFRFQVRSRSVPFASRSAGKESFRFETAKF